VLTYGSYRLGVHGKGVCIWKNPSSSFFADSFL
jgi:hypothetical protein